MQLSVNVDYFANLRSNNCGNEPDILKCARFCQHAGAEKITASFGINKVNMNLFDVKILNSHLKSNFTLKIPISKSNELIEKDLFPHSICIIPNVEEVSSSRGFDVIKNFNETKNLFSTMKPAGTFVSVFIEPELNQVTTSYKAGANGIKINTFKYAEAYRSDNYEKELTKVKEAAVLAKTLGMKVSLGKAIDYYNIIPLRELPITDEIDIGHSITAKALFTGLDAAIKQMKELIYEK